MRPRLLSDLASVGYEIFLEGNNVRYRYQGQGNPPDTVRPLIDELRKYKAEVVNILKMGSNHCTSTDKSPPRADVKAIWPPDVQSLVDWFMMQKAPIEPFLLEPHIRVVGPDKFFESLRREIKTGPNGSRARTGVLQNDLLLLKKVLH